MPSARESRMAASQGKGLVPSCPFVSLGALRFVGSTYYSGVECYRQGQCREHGLCL